MKRIVIALAVAAVLTVGAVSAWNMMDDGSVATASGPEHVVPREKVEEHAEEDFGRPFSGDAPDSVSCPRGLRAKKDDTMRCTAVFKGESKPMLISVTGVQGDEVTIGYGVLEKGSKEDTQGTGNGAGKGE
ncbi:DUF4333 domain-containing protein [Streptomyces decoyicus]|uniref:DUF4333 domain-containing protein n=1 Tax=Streptomyces decoyicus TaxID=249567 RepID=UPI002E35A2D4|nr:DUF4333 domain-containing protein [Streptomyces decoyicus]